MMNLPRSVSTTLAIGSLTVIAMAAAQETTDGYSFRLPGQGWIAIAGVCNADPQQITCWKPSGEPDAKLSELISAYYLINPQQRLDIRYKRRSLMLITQTLFGNFQGQRNINFNGLQVDPGGQLNQNGSIGYGGQGEETTSFCWYYPAEGLTTIDATALLNISTEGAKLALSVGAEAQLTGGRVRILAVEKASGKLPPQNQYGYQPFTKAPYWVVSYGLTGEGAEPVTSISANVFDRDGNVISSVDGRGNPAPPPRPNGLMYDSFRQNYPLAMASGNKITLAVNPQKVGYLMITGSAQKKVSFKHIALQPNK